MDLVHPDSWFVGRFNCCHTFVFMMKNALPTTLVSLAWACACAWAQVPRPVRSSVRGGIQGHLLLW